MGEFVSSFQPLSEAEDDTGLEVFDALHNRMSPYI